MILGFRPKTVAACKRTDADLLYQFLDVVVGGMRSSVVGNFVNAAIVLTAFSASYATSLLLAGVAVLIGLFVWRFRIIAGIEGKKTSVEGLRSVQRGIEINAACLGLWWGLAVALFLPSADLSQQMLLGIIAAGMMGAGAISFRSLKRAGRLYVSACGAACIAGFLALDSAAGYAAVGLTVCYLAVLLVNIGTTANHLASHILHRREAEEATETIKLLLNDFTEQGSDWLFELDKDGKLINPCERLAEAALRPVETLDGKIFLSLFDAGRDVDLLASHFRRKRAFRHCIVSLIAQGEQRWWSISARPALHGNCTFRGVITDITAQRQAEERVSYMAHYDGLTDLPNRFLFNESLNRAYHRRQSKIGLMFIDLDNFKAINDTLGHPVGDQLLKAVASRLESSLADGEVVARLGGDEFAVLVTGRAADRVEEVAADIIRAMSSPFSLDGHDVVIGASIGIARGPQHGENAEKLLQNADLALYTAKSLGRNRAACFEPGMDEAANARRLLELDLRSSIGKNEMRLHYQSLIDIETGKTTGYEALLRWEHPVRGIVMPGNFIPIAEETGLIVQLGEWVIRQAIDDLAEWDEGLSVAINLSPAQMRSASLISTIVGSMARTGVDPSRVCLEITETVLMQDSDANIATLHKLNNLGINIALDDFGTGYSSLNYLRSFPFQKIKIDRCFVNEIDTREDCQAIVRSVVGLAKSLGMTTSAEGVERVEQLERLRLEGCGEVQGFLYSKAIPAEELTDLRRPVSRNIVPIDAMREQLADEDAGFREGLGILHSRANRQAVRERGECQSAELPPAAGIPRTNRAAREAKR